MAQRSQLLHVNQGYFCQSELTSTVARVTDLYSFHTYPRYPLLATPRWAAGYTSSKIWIDHMFGQDHSLAERISTYNHSQMHGPIEVIAGCGEVLPWVMEQWRGSKTLLVGIDLSANSLRRAALRLALTQPIRSLFKLLTYPKGSWYYSLLPSPNKVIAGLIAREKIPFSGTILTAGDLDEFLAQCPGDFLRHMDAFGVLHHMNSPRRALARIVHSLKPGGTLRLMIYNSPSRQWIWNIQRLFKLLKWDYHSKQHLNEARQLLQLAAEESPRLKQFLGQMGPETLNSNARFADTFFHPREVRAQPHEWLRWCQEAGLNLVGFFDRYGEWDHAPNPLWLPPSGQDLSAAAHAGLFSGNIEIYLKKPGFSGLAKSPTKNANQHESPVTRLGRSQKVRAVFQGPPAHWFNFEETASIPTVKRMQIWQTFVSQLSTYSHRTPLASDPLTWDIPLPALKRLARLGAIFPHTLSAALKKELSKPLAPLPDSSNDKSTTAEAPTPTPHPPALTHLVERRWQELNFLSKRHETKSWQACQARLQRLFQ